MEIDESVLARVRADRAANVERKAALGIGAPMQAVRTVDVPVHGAPAVRVRLLAPVAEPRAVLVYLHGGGWVLGSIDTFDRLGRELAHRTQAVVVMVDYAKAPERPFPAAPADAWAAYTWAAAHVEAELADLGTPLQAGWRLLVGGDSAGGNLAAVVARRARETGTRLDGQLLIYPVTDSDLTRPSHLADPEGRHAMVEFWDLYASPDQRTSPDAAPIRAADLSGQAPALILNAEHDALNDEIAAYALRLAEAGVPVAHHTLPGSPHGVMSYWDTSEAAGAALEVIADWVQSIGT